MQPAHTHHAKAAPHQQPYGKLGLMGILSFISMYTLMYAMVNTFANVIPNVNQIYMAGLMTMPMLIIEVLLMSVMYPDKRRNALVIALSAVGLIGFFLLIRRQEAVGDRQFLKSMIPHHASAILMAGQADLDDPEVKRLSEKIIADQQAEIRQMKAKLEELDK